MNTRATKSTRVLSRALCQALFILTLLSAVSVALAAPTNKSLIKAADNPTVYWYQNNKYYPVIASTLDIMQSNGMPGWRWSSITTLPSIFLPRGPNQDFISTGSPSNGLLIKLRTDAAVYLIKDGKREFLSFEVFTQRGYSFDDVIDVPQQILNMFPELPRPDFRISTGVTSYTITQGETASIGITVDGSNGFNSPVELFGYNFPPNYVPQGTGWTPQVVTPPPTSPGAFATLKIATNSSTQVGTYTITLEGRGGGLTRQKNISLTVNSAAAPNFSVSTSISARTVSRGTSTSFNVTVQSNSAFSGPVSLRAINLPGDRVLPGTGFSPSQISLAPNQSGSSTFTLVTDDLTPLGTFTVRIEGVNGSLVRHANVSVTVSPRVTRCGDADAIRTRVTRNLTYLRDNTPPTYLPSQSPFTAVAAYRWQGYDQLYNLALRFRGLASDSLSVAARSAYLERDDVETGCKFVEYAERYIALMNKADSDAIEVWMNRLISSQEVVHRIAELLKEINKFIAGRLFGGVGSVAATILYLPLDYVNDYALYGKEEAVRRHKERILTDVLVGYFFDMQRIPSKGNKTLSELLEAGIANDVQSPQLYFLLNQLALKPEVESDIARLLAQTMGVSIDHRIQELAGEIVRKLKDYLAPRISPQQSGLQLADADVAHTASATSEADTLAINTSPVVYGTSPSSASAFVSLTLSRITVEFDQEVRAGSGGVTMTDGGGGVVPISGTSVLGNTLTANLSSRLTQGKVYRVVVQQGTVTSLSGTPNNRYEWGFTTSPPALTTNINVAVNDTGGVGLNLRSSPEYRSDGSNVVRNLPEGTRLRIAGGPVQADGYKWWNVTGDGISGWGATGDWLAPTDSVGLRVGASVTVANTSGVGLRLRNEPGLTGTHLMTLPEGTRMTVLGGPFYADGYIWWNISGPSGIGYSAVAYWLYPDASSEPKRLTISSVEPSPIQTKDWGESVSYRLTVKDDQGNAVSGATVVGEDQLRGGIFTTSPSTTDAAGQITHTVMVASGSANRLYNITFVAQKDGYAESAGVVRQVQVNHATPSCTYSISPAAQSFGSGGGSGSISVTANPSCSWAASSNAGFITITSSGGSGSGTVGYSVAANAGSAARTGTITAAGHTYTITQAGLGACTFNISPANSIVGSGGATHSINVDASASDCAWTATSNAGWITITSGTGGTGDGMVGYSLAANASGASRFGAITVAGQSFTVTQTATVNPIDYTPVFVGNHYVDFLNREPDASGLQFWTSEVENCGGDAQCREAKRINVSAAFFLSIEFQETGYFVYKTYKAAFGNLAGRPVPVRRVEFTADTRSISNGVIVNVGNWREQLEANKNAFALAFVRRADFRAAYPASLTAAEFISKLNANAGGVLDEAARGQLSDILTGGNGSDEARAGVLRRFAEDSTLHQREFNRAFVLMQYFGYLRRDPDSTPDADFSGYNFWLGKLNEFQGNFINAEMVKAFLNADEYRRRFGQ